MRKTTNYMILRGLVVAFFVVLVGRLWYMQVLQVNVYRAEAVNSRLIGRTVYAPRGIIYDNRGRPLVRNLPNFTVTITPDEWSTHRSVPESRLLSALLHHKPSAARIRREVAAHSTPAALLTMPFVLKANLRTPTFISVKTHSVWLPGVDATVNLTRREYTNTALSPLAHILGYTQIVPRADVSMVTSNPQYQALRYTWRDEMGRTGIEGVEDLYLHGKNGHQTAQVNGAGQQVTAWKSIQPVVPGYGVRLTINEKFENQVTADVAAGLAKLDVKQGAAVVEDPYTGKVLAMVSLPSFNNNLFTGPSSKRVSKKITALETNSKTYPLYDLVTQGTLPPGSIFKVITAAAGLETGVITPKTRIDDTGSVLYCAACRVFDGWRTDGLGSVDVVQAIERSSDIFFYQVAGGGPDLPGTGLGPKRLGTWARLFGLGRPTGVGLSAESSGTISSPQFKRDADPSSPPWNYADSYNMGIGQGATTVTPIQMATVASAIANGGSLVRPRLIDAITTPDGTHVLPGKDFGAVPTIERHQFIAPWVDALIRHGMRLGVTQWEGGELGGTSNWDIDQKTQAAGKTGTAELDKRSKVNGIFLVDGWWMGFAPYNHPKIAVCVVVPQTQGDGSTTAAPIASKIMDDYFNIKHPRYSHGNNNWLDYFQTGSFAN